MGQSELGVNHLLNKTMQQDMFDHLMRVNAEVRKQTDLGKSIVAWGRQKDDDYAELRDKYNRDTHQLHMQLARIGNEYSCLKAARTFNGLLIFCGGVLAGAAFMTLARYILDLTG